MTVPVAGDPGAQGLAAGRLRDIEAVTDVALSRLDEQALLNALVECSSAIRSARPRLPLMPASA